MSQNAPTQPANLWSARLNFHQILSEGLSESLSAALEESVISVFIHNKESTDGDNWSITLTTAGKPDIPYILQRVQEVAQSKNILLPLTENDIVTEPLPETDWLNEVHSSFPPFRIGRFFIHGSHYTDPRPQDSIPLQIDAATAFGSGEHETTRGCIQALENLSQLHIFTHGLDMGCGSGILAIAQVKLWPDMDVTAIDIDPEAIVVTNRHADMNGVAKKIRSAAGDGYNVPQVAKSAPYDLITANILANPLVSMATSLVAVLKKNGYAVLSGILVRQKPAVIEAHLRLGLGLIKEENLGDWATLVFRKT